LSRLVDLVVFGADDLLGFGELGFKLLSDGVKGGFGFGERLKGDNFELTELC
jgi:hypothetical protein